MGPTANPTDRTARARACLLILATGLAGLLGGCSTDIDNYLDPSDVGRYEATPTIVPMALRK